MEGQSDEASPSPEPQSRGPWTQLDAIRYVRAGSPLVFYALLGLALLVFGAVVVWALDGIYRFIFVMTITAVVVVMFGAVWWLNWKDPLKVVLGELSQYRLRVLQHYGTREHPVESQENDRLPSVPPDEVPRFPDEDVG